MRQADAVSGLVLAVGFGAALWEASSFQYSTEFAPGPGFAPVWLSALGVTLSLVTVASAWRARSAGRDRNEEPDERIDRTGLVRVAVTLLGLVIMLVLVPYTGFVSAVALFLLFMTVFVQRLRAGVSICASLMTAAGVYLVFVRLLGVPIPIGPLGF